jgi:ArsR family transcriptional regulator, arsenate/arsenite/antimonite-responsive transcriptional repressor
MQKLNVISCCRPLGASSLSDEEAEASAALFRALADPARVKIVNLLATSDEPVCACEFEPALELSQPTVSHHLKRLTEVGLLEREQRGKWAYFSLKPEASSQLERLVRVKEVV